MNLRRHLTALLLLLPAAAMAIPFAASEENQNGFVLGRDYLVLDTPIPTSTGGSIEVREFFFYGCSHCFDLERAVTGWLRTKPKDVEFVRTPAIMSAKWEHLGRAFYVADELKALEKVHAPLYNAIHIENNRALLSEQSEVVALFAKQGVPADKVKAAWDSFAVTTKVRNAEALTKKYKVSGTPTVTVNGRYVVPAQGARTFAVVDFLVKKERAARTGK